MTDCDLKKHSDDFQRRLYRLDWLLAIEQIIVFIRRQKAEALAALAEDELKDQEFERAFNKLFGE